MGCGLGPGHPGQPPNIIQRTRIDRETDHNQGAWEQPQTRPGRVPGWQPDTHGAFLGVPGCATRPPWLYWVVCLDSPPQVRACAWRPPAPLPPPGMCTCGEIVDENPARLAAPLSTTTVIVHRLALGWRKPDSEKRVQPLAGTTTGRGKIPAGENYRDAENRLLETTGIEKPGNSNLPG